MILQSIYLLYISFNAFDPRFIRQVLQHTRERVEGGVGRFLRHTFVIFYDDYQSQSVQGHALFWQVLATSKHIKAYQSTHSNHHGATYDMGWHQMIWQHLQSAADCMFGGLRCFDLYDISSLLWLCIFVMICMSPRGQRDGIEMLHGVVFKDEGRAPCSRSPVARREETSDRGGPSVHWCMSCHCRGIGALTCRHTATCRACIACEQRSEVETFELRLWGSEESVSLFWVWILSRIVTTFWGLKRQITRCKHFLHAFDVFKYLLIGPWKKSLHSHPFATPFATSTLDTLSLRLSRSNFKRAKRTSRCKWQLGRRPKQRRLTSPAVWPGHKMQKLH